jgi:hypothetical protein
MQSERFLLFDSYLEKRCKSFSLALRAEYLLALVPFEFKFEYLEVIRNS